MDITDPVTGDDRKPLDLSGYQVEPGTENAGLRPGNIGSRPSEPHGFLRGRTAPAAPVANPATFSPALQPGAAWVAVETTNAAIAASVLRLQSILSRVHGQVPSPATDAALQPLSGPPVLMDALRRQVALAQAFTALLAEMEQYL